MAAVELKGLGKRYGDAVAVENVSMMIGHGQLVCLLGPLTELNYPMFLLV